MVPCLLVLQFLLVFSLVWWMSQYAVFFYFLLVLLSLAMVLWVLGKSDNPSYKLAWIIAILILPVFGGVLYLMFGTNSVSHRLKRRMNQIIEEAAPHLEQNPQVTAELKALDGDVFGQSKYILNTASYPMYQKTTMEYYPLGEAKWIRLLEELEKAEHYIFMEYFILEDGIMWSSVLEILEQKAAEGLDVRVMYDDVGSLNTLPTHYDRQLEAKGIKAVVFNPFRAYLSVKLNNRDHRKIVVIDGHTGFTGGINLADEYINAYEKHGHWKDTAVMLKGEAVWNLTLMFLQLWNFSRPTDADYSCYMPHVYHPEEFESDGFVQPYGSTPLDPEPVGENVYMNIINKAEKYVYIATPYLIVDHELITALSLAAKSGVDVRIITPHIPDKWYVHLLTQSYYKELLLAGVKIYEYTPGFIHAKMFVSDDKVATVGTINMDYRSLYLHFECGVFMYRNRIVAEVYDDCIKTMEKSEQITLQKTKEISVIKRIVRSILRIFAPLM